MRFLLTLSLALFLVSTASAQDPQLGSRLDKSHAPRLSSPGIPDGREGGEAMSDAIPITAFPFEDTGNTSDNLDDYDAVCPYSGSTSPDVVYLLPQRTEDLWLMVDMCGSGYDTKIYIMDGNLEVFACNDDTYFSDPCGQYVSAIEEAALPGGGTYYLVIDGYGGESGDYTLLIEELEAPIPCLLECSGWWEGEPPLHDGYVDMWNSGCNDETGYYPFQELGGICGPPNLTLCGKSGWYDAGFRDTDWFICSVGETGIVHWTMDAEQETYGFLLSPQDCSMVAVEESFTVGPCAPGTMVIQGNPGDMLWLWVGPTTYVPPTGFTGFEYDYVMTMGGIIQYGGTTATEKITLDRIKTLYR